MSFSVRNSAFCCLFSEDLSGFNKVGGKEKNAEIGGQWLIQKVTSLK